MSRYAEPGADKPLSAIKELLESELRTVEKSGRCAILTGYPSSSGKIYKYPAGDIYDLTDERFEDMLIPIPADFDEWLTVRYGSNYLDIPKNGKRKHKDVFIDPENSYETYDGGGLRWKSKR